MVWEQETGKRYRMSLPHDVYSGIGETTISTLVDNEDVQHSSSNSNSSALRFPECYDGHAEDDDVVDEYQQETACNGRKNGSNEVVVPENKEDDTESRSSSLCNFAVPPPSGLKVRCCLPTHYNLRCFCSTITKLLLI